jgi:hypothetical protein
MFVSKVIGLPDEVQTVAILPINVSIAVIVALALHFT